MHKMTATFANTLFVCVDIQERLIGAMADSEGVLKNSQILINGAHILGNKILVSEQYIKGLGKTDKKLLDSLESLDSHQVQFFEKTTFSIFNDREITLALNEHKKNGIQKLIFFGIEAHVCIFQSVMHALEYGYDVWVVGDCISSRNEANCLNAKSLMSQLGAKITNTESVIFGSIVDSKDTNFKALSNLIK